MHAELMQPIISNNGTSRRELIDQRIAVRRTIEATMGALGQTAPHGRDYHGRPDAYQRDLAIYRARFAVLDKLHNELSDEALAIQTGREG